VSAQLPPLHDVEPAPELAAPPPGPTRRRPGRLLGIAGASLLTGLVAVAVFAPLLARHDPEAISGLPFQPPTVAHPLGTNDVGEDLFAQLLYGARISLTIALLSALVAITIGLVVALVAGYHRGRVETVLMRLVDLTLSFPFLVLVIVLAAFFGRGLGTTVLVIAAVIWARPARVLRAQVIKVRQFQHVTAAQAMGASARRIIGRHLLPRIAPLAAAQFVRAANVSVMLEAALAFLGLGDPNRVSWGTILHFANARNAFLTDAWAWWVLPPGLALTAAIVGFAFVGYAVEEWADPRLARTTRRHPGRRRSSPSLAAHDADARPDAPVLEVRELSVHYETSGAPVRAVDRVDVVVQRGQIVGLVGESGSGKSTLAMTLMGLLRPPARVVAGNVRLEGRDVGKARRSLLAAVRGRSLALVPQSAMNSLNPAYTIHRQVAEAAALTRDAAEAAREATELLELVGIPVTRHQAYPHELSGGMRQRVVIAMAVANRPSLLIADEPVTGLDVVTQARILRLLLDLRARFGMAMLLISHDLPLVAHAADEMLVMYGGKIVERDATAAVSGNPQHPYTRHLLRAFPTLHGPRADLAALSGETAVLTSVATHSGDGRGSAAGAVASDVLLDVRAVCKVYERRGALARAVGHVAALDDVSLAVAPGEIVGLVGQSGAGKSTLARLILGLEHPDAGEVLLRGVDLASIGARALRAARRRLALILQDPYESLHPGMRVGRAVAEPLLVAGVPSAERAARAADALEEVGLTPASSYVQRYPHELSGGQRQRLAIARALVGRPDLVIADEPTSMLDASVRAGILQLITRMRDHHGTAFVFITHDLAMARYVADRIAVMQGGQIVEVAETEHLIASPAHPYTQTLLEASESVR
jgi:ABC-type glutathione transport system ATPase component/ABC-type dipeptide/oligopeptide/nickel transport system permease subunit